MANMIERATRAAKYEAEYDYDGGDILNWLDIVRAVLKELQEPTEEMVIAGVKVCSAAIPTEQVQTAVIYGQPKDIWRAMINKALDDA